MSGFQDDGQDQRRDGKVARFIGRFLLEWIGIVAVGAGVSIAVDAVWSVMEPETAAGALLELRQGFVPWLLATFVGLAIYKVLKGKGTPPYLPPLD